jgi:hypothetical protein
MSIENSFGHASIDPSGDYRQAKDRQSVLLGAAAEYHADQTVEDTTIDITPTLPKRENRLLKLIPRAFGLAALLLSTSCVPGELNTTSVLTPPDTASVEPTRESVPMQPMIDNGGISNSRANENPMVPQIRMQE